MLENAISKIKSEMTGNTNNPYIQVVGGFLLQRLEGNPSAAQNILSQDKTIAKSLDEMRKVAEKKKVGNCAVLTDQEGFGVVLKYFGIDSAVPAVSTRPVPPRATPQPTNPETDFDIKLEDLL